MRCLASAALFATLIASSAHAQGDIAECYDAVVSGRIEAQTPSVFPESDDGSITMVWPWFLKLKVRKAIVGAVPAGSLLVLSMQHTKFRKDLGWRRWWLRRNSIGGFNLLRFGGAERLPRCSADVKAAEPLIRPGPNKTLDDLLKEGERAYRAVP